MTPGAAPANVPSKMHAGVAAWIGVLALAALGVYQIRHAPDAAGGLLGQRVLNITFGVTPAVYYHLVRRLTRTADVVVLNHALVFSDLNVESGVLPPYNEIIFDEGHKLEDVATEGQGTIVTFHYGEGKKVPVPEELRRRIAALEATAVQRAV